MSARSGIPQFRRRHVVDDLRWQDLANCREAADPEIFLTLGVKIGLFRCASTAQSKNAVRTNAAAPRGFGAATTTRDVNHAAGGRSHEQGYDLAALPEFSS